MWTGGHVLSTWIAAGRGWNMEREPRIALTVIDGDNLGGWLTLLGQIERFYADEELADIDKLALRYQG